MQSLCERVGFVMTEDNAHPNPPVSYLHNPSQLNLELPPRRLQTLRQHD